MDSPKCPLCLETGVIAQTYKIAGKSRFKCQRCGSIFSGEVFEPVDFKWKTEPDNWQNVYEAKVKSYEDQIRKNVEKAIEMEAKKNKELKEKKAK